MKSVKAFLLMMLLLYAGLFFFDWLKADVYTHEKDQQMHSLLTKLKTIFLAGGGVLIMKLTLEKRMFRLFLITYITMWVIYYILKFTVNKTGGETDITSFSLSSVFLFYLNITQILTPFPFFLFWILNRVIRSGIFRN